MKRRVLWLCYAAFVLVLFLGAANRTQAIAADASAADGANQFEHTEHEADEQAAPLQAVVQVQGVVLSTSNREMILGFEDGSTLAVARRPWRFAAGQGFLPQNGDVIVVAGFRDQSEFEVRSMTNLTTGQVVHLRDESGRPLWASEH